MTVKINVKDKLEDDILDLSFCDLEEVPIREIIPIKKASRLDLSNNQLTSIPNTIVTLTNIVKLDLSKNMLTEIPENIGEMRQLRHLDLYSNQISRLPLSLGDLKNLKWLDLKQNPLTPAVASVAGMCSNSIECQNCARNIVAYLSNVKRDIEEERLRRIKASITNNNSNDSTIKKESKKMKKKKNTDKGEINIKDVSTKLNSQSSFPISQANKTEHPKKKHPKETKSFSGELCNIFTSILYSTSVLLIILGILIPLLIVCLPRFDRILSNNVVSYLELQTKLPIKSYQKLGIQTMDSIINNMLLIFDKFKSLLMQHYENI